MQQILQQQKQLQMLSSQLMNLQQPPTANLKIEVRYFSIFLNYSQAFPSTSCAAAVATTDATSAATNGAICAVSATVSPSYDVSYYSNAECRVYAPGALYE
jgi:hypothetical protein